MCRLLGYVTAAPTTLAGLLGERDLADFTELSGRHCDGWGLAWATGDGVAVDKSPQAARVSDGFGRRAREHRSDLGFVHLRQATPGLPVRPENTHPFTDGWHAFAHNGAIRPAASLDRVVPAGLQARRAGDTDSERYFLAVLGRLRHLPPAEALAATVAEISAGHVYTSLNCLLATPDALYAVCRFDPAAEEREEPEYFRLRYRASGGAVVVASTGWGAGWDTIGNGELLTVRRHSLQVSVRSIADSVVAS